MFGGLEEPTLKINLFVFLVLTSLVKFLREIRLLRWFYLVLTIYMLHATRLYCFGAFQYIVAYPKLVRRMQLIANW